ncbi:MAG: BatD family protein [Betaproteobacteria bacterium]
MRAALFITLLLALFTTLAARAAPAPYLIETEFEPARAYVGAEMVLRQRLLRLPGVPYGALRPPRLGEDADVSPPIGYGRDFEAARAGTTYSVREHTYLVIPRRAGRFVLPAPELLGPLRQAKDIVQPSRGAPRVLEVHPARSEAGEPWLPARRLWLEESWSGDPASLAAGAAVVRTLTVRAEGLTGDRLPRLEMAAQPGLSVHHDTSRFSSEHLETGMAGRSAQRVVLIPLEEGVIELPALSLRWWDILADAPRLATLPARSLRATAAAIESAAPAPAPAEPVPLNALRAFAIALLAGCVLLLWAYLRRQPEREARQRLRLACARGDAPAAREALLEWWQAAFPADAAPLLQRMGEGWDETARVQLAALDAALYGGRAWDGQASWRALRPWLRKKTLPRKRTSTSLPPLFKLQARQ